MTKLPPLGSLRAFEVAARRLSFRDAALELGVTPTAISHQIRVLEEICGRPLFRRRPRPLALTDAGARLFPAIRDGFELFASAVAAAKSERVRLRVTTTNAFAGRWLVPRLPKWRVAHEGIALEIIGTDAVLDLRAGDADLAVRYARGSPGPRLLSAEIFRDCFYPVCAPSLLAKLGHPIGRPDDLRRLPLIHFDWPSDDREAPTWARWFAQADGPRAPRSNGYPIELPCELSFREELHAIEAVLAGQGIAICSDILVGDELAAGVVVKAYEMSLPGYSFSVIYLPDHPKRPQIEAFAAWMRAAT
jgi:LysR family transcriptional regulator, glycine cleavage system transcriptional activator